MVSADSCVAINKCDFFFFLSLNSYILKFCFDFNAVGREETDARKCPSANCGVTIVPWA